LGPSHAHGDPDGRRGRRAYRRGDTILDVKDARNVVQDEPDLLNAPPGRKSTALHWQGVARRAP
jgi:hypothetical protein